MSEQPLIHKWRVALFGWTLAWGIYTLLCLANPNPVGFLLTIALFALTAWLIGRLRARR